MNFSFDIAVLKNAHLVWLPRDLDAFANAYSGSIQSRSQARCRSRGTLQHRAHIRQHPLLGREQISERARNLFHLLVCRRNSRGRGTSFSPSSGDLLSPDITAGAPYRHWYGRRATIRHTFVGPCRGTRKARRCSRTSAQNGLRIMAGQNQYSIGGSGREANVGRASGN